MKIGFFLSMLLCLEYGVHELQADNHGGVHVRIPTCENDTDSIDECDSTVAIEMKPWYYQYQVEEDEDEDQLLERFDHDTSWPGQREEFSDQLRR